MTSEKVWTPEQREAAAVAFNARLESSGVDLRGYGGKQTMRTCAIDLQCELTQLEKEFEEYKKKWPSK